MDNPRRHAMTDYLLPRSSLKFAPRDIFEQILEYAVIPTFDLVLEVSDRGVLLLRRIIPPYQDVWALPGLRMMKPEDISDTIRRIAQDEVNLEVDPENRIFLGQFVGKFTEEHQRQDLSTGFFIPVSSSADIHINEKHFSAMKFVNKIDDAPSDTGAMYGYYLREFFRRRERGEV
jgi:8-oxo-dGTP pyrophosphatase MutT (NUDIX family)